MQMIYISHMHYLLLQKHLQKIPKQTGLLHTMQPWGMTELLPPSPPCIIVSTIFIFQQNRGKGNEIGQESTFWRRLLWEKAGSKMSKSLKLAGDFELWLRFFQHDSLYVVNSLFGIFRQREGQLSSNIEQYWEEADIAIASLPLTQKEDRIIKTYLQREKLSRFINKSKIFNGRKISRLNMIEKKVYNEPSPIFL